MSLVNQSIPKNLKKELKRWEYAEGNKGQIYTRPEVVSFMLTVMGLDDIEAKSVRILEPACGEGEFVVAIVEKLVRKKPRVDELLGSLVAVELVGSSLTTTKAKVATCLAQKNYAPQDINLLLENWFVQADYLLHDFEPNFTHIIGNPPYVRLESIPKTLLKRYRQNFKTMTDRADLYIPFFEKSLSLLTQDGKLSFLYTDRWTKNTYGRALRQYISDGFSLEVFVDLYGADAFEADVLTYPAITQIVKKSDTKTIFHKTKNCTNLEADDIFKALNGKAVKVDRRKGVVDGSKPWVLAPKVQSSLIHKLEQNFPTLEEAGCSIHLGAATGANKIFIVDKSLVDIEESRLLPVVMAKDLEFEGIQWSGKYIINTFENGTVIKLEEYPRLNSYLNNYRHVLSKRYKAKRNLQLWYKTVSWVHLEHFYMQKLLIPDIRSQSVAVIDNGEYYPNNSIYYLCSSTWDLQALRVVLLSDITKQFLDSYSTKLSKGYLRFQAQYLKRLRLPVWNSVSTDLKVRMIHASLANDVAIFNDLTMELYQLN